MTTRVPISVAAKRGVSSLAASASTERVVLVNHGRPVAVVDSAERLDADLRLMREAALAVLDCAADKVASRSLTHDLDSVCKLLDLDPEKVRALAASRSARTRSR